MLLARGLLQSSNMSLMWGVLLYTAGVWQDKVELKSLRKTERSFLPSDARTVEYKGVIAEWMRAMSRCRDWNKTVDM